MIPETKQEYYYTSYKLVLQTEPLPVSSTQYFNTTSNSSDSIVHSFLFLKQLKPF